MFLFFSAPISIFLLLSLFSSYLFKWDIFLSSIVRLLVLSMHLLPSHLYGYSWPIQDHSISFPTSPVISDSTDSGSRFNASIHRSFTDVILLLVSLKPSPIYQHRAHSILVVALLYNVSIPISSPKASRMRYLLHPIQILNQRVRLGLEPRIAIRTKYQPLKIFLSSTHTSSSDSFENSQRCLRRITLLGPVMGLECLQCHIHRCPCIIVSQPSRRRCE